MIVTGQDRQDLLPPNEWMVLEDVFVVASRFWNGIFGTFEVFRAHGMASAELPFSLYITDPFVSTFDEPTRQE